MTRLFSLISLIFCLGLIGCAGGMPKSVSICILGHQNVAVEQPTTSDRATSETSTDADASIVPK